MNGDSFANHTNINWNGSVGTAEYGGGDKNMVVMFYNNSIQDNAKSAETGRPFFRDVIFVKMYTPGEQRFNIIDRPARQDDKQRFPMQWAKFSQNQEQTPEGTPIDMLYPEHPSVAALLKANGVWTIEQCAELSGSAIDNIGMGSQRYVNDAQKYLELANKGVKATQFRKELEDRDSKIRTLEHQIEIMKTQLDQLNRMASESVDMNTVEALLAARQGRPQYPGARQLPQQFDAQLAQIDATHKTTDISRSRKRQKIS